VPTTHTLMLGLPSCRCRSGDPRARRRIREGARGTRPDDTADQPSSPVHRGRKRLWPANEW